MLYKLAQDVSVFTSSAKIVKLRHITTTYESHQTYVALIKFDIKAQQTCPR
jgi:hypothetical protein